MIDQSKNVYSEVKNIFQKISQLWMSQCQVKCAYIISVVIRFQFMDLRFWYYFNVMENAVFQKEFIERVGPSAGKV